MGWVSAIATSVSITSVIDSAGNNWTSAYAIQQDVTGVGSSTYFLPSASNLGGITSVTITFGQAQSGALAQVREYSGLQAPVTAVDKSTHQLSSANPATSGATTATTVATELVIGVANYISASANPNWTVGSGFSNFFTSSFNFGGPVIIYVALEDKEVSSTGAQTALFTNPNGASTGTAVATLKEPSVSGHNLNLLGVGA